MSSAVASAYLFETAAQWDACLFAGADRLVLAKSETIAPEAPYGRDAHHFASSGAAVPAFTPAGELLWRDAGGELLRALPGDLAPQRATAPWAIAHAARLITSFDTLWSVVANAPTIEAFELDSLVRTRVVTVPGARIVDAAADGHGGLLVLIEGAGGFEIAAVADDGRIEIVSRLEPGAAPTRIAYLATHRRVLLLDRGGTRLLALQRGASAPLWSRQLAVFRPCFVADELASDGRGRLFVTGSDGALAHAAPAALVLDADATLIDAFTLDRKASGIAGARGLLAVSDAQGLSVFGKVAVASPGAALECELATPMLSAPDSGAEPRWQRADLWATLPEGTTLDLRYGWSDDPELIARANKLSSDPRISGAERLAWLLGSLPNWSAPVSFAGNAGRALSDEPGLAPPLAFPLHDARSSRLWLHLRLRATPGAALPAVSKMSVSYAGSAMLQQLPAIYRRTATTPGDFLGALVGTLEAGSQELDRRIAGLGSLVHPDTAPEPWLDEVAEWIGLPWDDALSLAQKRAIASRAGELSAQRGTRQGLALLLSSLFPGEPPRHRIRDLDVDFGFVRLGGSAAPGSALPAVLAGLPRSASVLSRKAILGQALLPCGGVVPSATRHLSGRLSVELFVDGAVWRASRPWLARLIDAMVPAGLRVDLRWRTPTPDESTDAPLPHLGRDAITGSARLPRGRAPTLWP